MKHTTVIGIMAVTVMLAGCGMRRGAPTKTTVAEQMSLVARSQVIAYASVDTNNYPNLLLTVTEIWKGSHKASTLGFTNGMQFSSRWPANGGMLPDHAVVTYSPGRGVWFVRSGRVLGMTIQQFKTKAGL